MVQELCQPDVVFYSFLRVTLREYAKLHRFLIHRVKNTELLRQRQLIPAYQLVLKCPKLRFIPDHT